ncbi:MAG: hypothetical protein FWF50_06140 [Defluviitaleaceae bacterium]|nr:hypothetical protein [Defluviitaleaceae bacterium]
MKKFKKQKSKLAAIVFLASIMAFTPMATVSAEFNSRDLVFAEQQNELELELITPFNSSISFNQFLTNNSWIAFHLVPAQYRISHISGSVVYTGIVTRVTTPTRVNILGSGTGPTWGATFRGNLTSIGHFSADLEDLSFLDNKTFILNEYLEQALESSQNGIIDVALFKEALELGNNKSYENTNSSIPVDGAVSSIG